MNNLNLLHHTGVIEFLQKIPEDLALGLARLISKNLLTANTQQEAIKVILVHSTSVESILNRKVITKELIFQYLHSKEISTANDFTKQKLIETLIKYWQEVHNNVSNTPVEQSSAAPAVKQIHGDGFPIHQMAEVFAKWFFNVYNNDELKREDFYPDAKASMQVIEGLDTDLVTNTQETESTDNVLELLKALKSHYQFYFNPNTTENGVQGRLDVHGLAYVLNCGTLHLADRFVGVYESAFGLLRDPFSDDNWRIKHLKMRVRSTVDVTQQLPRLQDCDSLKEILAILPSQNTE